MGRAKIVTNVGAGLYRATPLYDLGALEAELAKIQEADAAYSALLLQMLRTIADLRDAKAVAAVAVDAVIEQWQAKLIDALNRFPPPIPPPEPNDPETGQPWEDPDRAQAAPLLAAINAARAGAGRPALSRNAELNKAALALLREQAGTGRIGHVTGAGLTPANRVARTGYAASAVGETLDYGASTPAQVVANWQRGRESADILLSPGYADAGIAHVHARNHPAGYLWAAVYAAPGTPPPNVTEVRPDPAKQRAEQTEATLEKIEPPKTDPLTPENMGKIAGAFALAAAKLVAAERALEKAMAAKLARASRKAELEKIKTRLESRVIDVWACYFTDSLAVGDTVYTAEVPGDWRDGAVIRSETIYPNTVNQRAVIFEERSWNIVRRFDGFDSRLKPSVTMTPEAVFYNAALEPAHLKWRPAWRYAVIEAMAGGRCVVRLNPAFARRAPTERASETLDLNPDAGPVLADVPVDYPPCGASAFLVGDEVLVRFAQQDCAKPVIVGFRRAPRSCAGRTWEQIV